MIRIFNINFTRFGNFKRLNVRLRALVIVLLMSSIAGFGRSFTHPVDSLAEVYKKTDDAENFIYACLDLYLAAPTENNLVVFAQYEKSIWRNLVTGDEQLAYVILLCNKGYYLAHYGDVYQSITAYEYAWKLFQDHKLAAFDIIEYCLKPLGNNYSMLGDYTSAENIIRNYLFLAEQEKNYEHIAGAVINLSIVYHDTGHHRAAIDILSSILNRKEIPDDKKGLIYANLARNFEVVNEVTKARHFAGLSITFLQQHKTFDTPVHLVNSYKILSLISLHEKDTVKSINLFKKGQTIAFQNREVFKPRELAKLMVEYGGLLKLDNEYPEALRSYQQALMILLPSYQPPNEEGLPDEATFYAENAIKEALDGLAELYERLNKPQTAVACYERSFVVEDLLRATYNYQTAKLQQQIENRERAARVIELLFDLERETGDPRYAVRAFQVAERTKAITLKEITEDRYIRRLISRDSLLQHESQLLFKQAILSNELVLEQNKQHRDAKHIRDLADRQTRLVIELKAIQQAIGEKYPYAAERHPSWLDINAVFEKLGKDNAVLVEYFSGEDVLFQFIVTADSISLYRIGDSKSIEESILRLDDLFSDAANINNQIDGYKKTAFTLFRQLHLDNIPSQQKLVLVPDGLLHTIPFDALLYENASGLQYAGFPYMIKKYSIAYQPSALLYTHYHKASLPLKKQRLLALFPAFENTAQSLPYSLSEAENIRHYFSKGAYLLKEQATKKAFLENAPRYSIIHLSTHAVPGNGTEPPSIYFRDSILYLPEIYGMQMSPDLMVLSACETGVGKIARGEGALSLAHGFQFAGVRNIILSLWKVNDRSTAVLFSDFYRDYLKTGVKADALRQAKLDYLSDEGIQNSHKSPFYWAAFIFYGDYEQSKERESYSMYGMIAMGVVLVLMIVYILRRKWIKV